MKGMRSLCFYDYKGSMFLFSSASIWVPADVFRMCVNLLLFYNSDTYNSLEQDEPKGAAYYCSEEILRMRVVIHIFPFVSLSDSLSSSNFVT